MTTSTSPVRRSLFLILLRLTAATAAAAAACGGVFDFLLTVVVVVAAWSGPVGVCVCVCVSEWIVVVRKLGWFWLAWFGLAWFGFLPVLRSTTLVVWTVPKAQVPCTLSAPVRVPSMFRFLFFRSLHRHHVKSQPRKIPPLTFTVTVYPFLQPER